MMKKFIFESIELLDGHLSTLESCITRLSEQDLWNKLKPELNSIGNLCLHLTGSEYQHIVCGIGGKPFIRKRSHEFLAKGGITGQELIFNLKKVRDQSKQVLMDLNVENLHELVTIHYPPDSNVSVDDYTRSCLSIILFVVEHSSYHTGQIVYMTKLLQESDHHILKWRH
ncbi:DinB family protein [Paenibacillus ginsengarvi]|uniref:DUF1572 domain-containing protein n=1 Tax=Paenibacillus ginsengarvi TaxID=400777 RepID=A0A3B0AHA5_9BACL|nr:DinB family protein [Paenibacillus ginsengarvi]RKN59980.1 DUF1572 domain-containing protein [Paenibacillus ginsengarvi]